MAAITERKNVKSNLPEGAKLFFGYCEIFKTFPKELDQFQIELFSDSFVTALSRWGRRYFIADNETHWFLFPELKPDLSKSFVRRIETKHYHKIPKNEIKP